VGLGVRQELNVRPKFPGQPSSRSRILNNLCFIWGEDAPCREGSLNFLKTLHTRCLVSWGSNFSVGKNPSTYITKILPVDYLSMKEGNLFCFVLVFLFVLKLWDLLNRDASDRVLGVFGKLLMRRGCMGLVPWCLDLWCKSSSI
jgi:hypothetical protein